MAVAAYNDTCWCAKPRNHMSHAKDETEGAAAWPWRDILRNLKSFRPSSSQLSSQSTVNFAFSQNRCSPWTHEDAVRH